MKLANYIALSLSVGLVGACAPGPGPGGEAPGAARSASEPGATVARKPAPTPRPAIEVPAGATLSIIVDTALSSKTSQPGDSVQARLASDLLADTKVVAPAGSVVRGKVTVAVPSGRVKTRARLAFVFDSIMIAGAEQSIQTREVDITAEDSHTRDAVTIAGAAGAGAVIGGIADGGKGAGIGALIGAGAGTGVVLIDKGKNVNIPAGATLGIELTQALRVRH